MDKPTTANNEPKLFMMMLGCKPLGRHTEQHDIFFGVGHSPKDLIPEIKAFWAEADKIHIDAWREVTVVNGYQINITDKQQNTAPQPNTLFFINLGGYTENVFDEQHYKLLTVNPDIPSAKAYAKQTLFYQEVQFEGAPSHIDDLYAVDVDDIHAVEDILPAAQQAKYSIRITQADNLPQDAIHLGYFKFNTLP